MTANRVRSRQNNDKIVICSTGETKRILKLMQHHIIHILVSVYFIVECLNGHVLKNQLTLFTFNSNKHYVICAYIRIYAKIKGGEWALASVTL